MRKLSRAEEGPTEAPVLAFPVFHQGFLLDTDASGVGPETGAESTEKKQYDKNTEELDLKVAERDFCLHGI